MATFYAKQFIGVKDGTKTPASRADGRQVGAKIRSIIADKNPSGSTQALAAADKLFIGTLPAGATPMDFVGLTDVTLGTSTISIGTLADATKYVNAKTLTAVDTPTSIGVKASAREAGPVAADEDLYATIGTATVAAATKLSIETRYVISA